MEKISQLAAGLGLLAAIAASQFQFGAAAAGLVVLGAASISSPAFAQNQPCNDNGTHCSAVKAYNRTNVTRCFRFYLPTGTRQFTPADGTHRTSGGYILVADLHIPFLDQLVAAPRGRREPTLWPLSMANGSKSLKRRNKNSALSCSPMQLAASGETFPGVVLPSMIERTRMAPVGRGMERAKCCRGRRVVPGRCSKAQIAGGMRGNGEGPGACFLCEGP
ncbi:hypothetical protein [Sinorhizobium meliloti]|uniref:hypothetical protein n=1 Tax=Rhizobium meliloti TaxID=382 RepID=UPI000FD36A65|nr:hypothetical protein [Sinorhizobium meliloti]RVJ86884.1 hypothetical protein CN173_30310 [Sinorhizobium meliloti]